MITKQEEIYPNGLTTDSLLGDIQVYREYKPRIDAVEFTIFFRERWIPGSVKYRMDFTIKTKAFDGMNEEQMKGYVQGRFHERYERGLFTVATAGVMGTREGYAVAST